VKVNSKQKRRVARRKTHEVEEYEGNKKKVTQREKREREREKVIKNGL